MRLIFLLFHDNPSPMPVGKKPYLLNLIYNYFHLISLIILISKSIQNQSFLKSLVVTSLIQWVHMVIKEFQLRCYVENHYVHRDWCSMYLLEIIPMEAETVSIVSIVKCNNGPKIHSNVRL